MKRIDHIYRKIEKVLWFILFLWLFVLSAGLPSYLLDRMGWYANQWYKGYYQIIKPELGWLGCFVLLLVVVLEIVGRKASRSVQIGEVAGNSSLEGDVANPLVGLTDAQEVIVVNLLREAAKPKGADNRLNRAATANFLRALNLVGYISDVTPADVLRRWVIQETGYEENDVSHFNEAYDRASSRTVGVRKYRGSIEKLLAT